MPTARGDKLRARFINFGVLFFDRLPRNTAAGEQGLSGERVVRADASGTRRVIGTAINRPPILLLRASTLSPIVMLNRFIHVRNK